MPIKQTPTKISKQAIRIPKPQPKKLRIVRNGKDGNTPSKEELLEMIRPLIPEIPKNVPKKALIKFMEEYIAKKPLTPLTVDFNMVETDAGTEVTINGVMHLIPRAVYGPKLRNFLQMGDTPDSFQGQAGKSAVVSADEQRIEFQTISVPPDTDTLQSVTDRGSTTTNVLTNTAQPTFTYTSGLLTSIAYSNGTEKAMTYNGDGTMNTLTITYPAATPIIKTFNWLSGVLQSITIA